MENRFLQILKVNKSFFLKVRSFFTLTGVTVIILVFIEIFFINLSRNKLETECDNFMADYKHHPYLDFTMEYRENRGVCKKEDKVLIKIDMYGGSTMWGVGVDNNQTIPSYYENILCEEGLNVEVRNKGQLCHNNSQEVINFFLEIKKGSIPDIVIFYDGANELYAPIPGYPSDLKTMQVFEYYIRKHRSENYFPNTINWVKEKMVNIGLREYYQPTKNSNIEYFDYPYPHKDSSYEEILDAYFQNVKTVKKLEEVFGFKSFFYWQPNITTKKTLSNEEKKTIRYEGYLVAVDIYSTSNELVSSFLDNTDKVIDLRNIFNDFKNTVFFDDCHKYPHGNKIIAERMIKDTLNHIKNK